ncbi:MAG TPA: HEAT repeat domain-containing protein [Pyrinomonadaceae bacterium]|nr:HEAT repeat domain-containing protein [Pyrinomonadaceae bacterium]
MRCAASLCLLFALTPRPLLAAHASPRAPQNQTALTPLQLEIEKQRRRLSSGEQEERRDAVQRLGAMARPEASRVASVALGDSSVAVRATAARAVLSLGPQDAATLLLPLLRDKDEFVRRETAYALGLAGHRMAVPALATALARDKEAGVRGAAAVALGQIGDPSAVGPLSEALNRGTGRGGFLSRVTRRTREENEFVRRAAAVSLGQIASREAVPALVAALSNERAGDDVRREAARALGLVGDPSAAPALRAVLDARDPYLSQIAEESLRKLGPTQAARPT